MMTMDPNWKREDESSGAVDLSAYPKVMLNPESKLPKFEKEFPAEDIGEIYIFSAIESAWQSKKSNRSGNKLDVTFGFVKDGTKMYSKVAIMSNKDRMSNEMHDFLMLCNAQNGDILGDAVTRMNYGKNEIIYPRVSGCRLKCSIATVSRFQGNSGKWFYTHTAKFYSTDGRSQREIEAGSLEAHDHESDLEYLKKRFQKYLTAPESAPQQNYGNNTNSFGGQTYAQAQTQPQSAQQADDDIPF